MNQPSLFLSLKAGMARACSKSEWKKRNRKKREKDNCRNNWRLAMKKKREDVSSTRGRLDILSIQRPCGHRITPAMSSQLSQALEPPVSKLESVIPGLNASESVVLRPSLRIWWFAGVQGETCNRIVSSSVWRCFGVAQSPAPVQRLGPCIHTRKPHVSQEA